MDEPVNLPKFMIVAPASNTATCPIRKRDNEPCLKDDSLVPIQRIAASYSPNVDAVRYMPPECRDEKMDRRNDVKKSDKISKMN